MELEVNVNLRFPELSDGQRTVSFWRSEDGNIQVDINGGTTLITLSPEVMESTDTLFQKLGGVLLDPVFGKQRDRLSREEVSGLYRKLSELEAYSQASDNRPDILRAGRGAWIENNSKISYFSRTEDGLIKLGGEVFSSKASVSPSIFFESLEPVLDKVFGAERDRLTREESDILFYNIREKLPVQENYSELSYWDTMCAYRGYFCSDHSDWVESFEIVIRDSDPNKVFFISETGKLLAEEGVSLEPITADGITYQPYEDETEKGFSQGWLDAQRVKLAGNSLVELGERAPFPLLTTLRWTDLDGESVLDKSISNASIEVGETGLTMLEFAKKEFAKSTVLPKEYAEILASGIPAQETNFNNSLISSADARSAWQVLPSTARHLGSDVSDLNSFETATPIARKYFEELWQTFSAHPKIEEAAATWTPAQTERHLVLPSVISAYHAGPGRVSRMLDQAELRLSLPNETFQRMAVEYARSDIDRGWGTKSVTYFPKVVAFARGISD